ncbi:MAG: phosphoglycolate phosphatase [Euryarchaeota archaeon]|nr:phosphoglycolate phosphatase [Euryarchaeota archaeon]
MIRAVAFDIDGTLTDMERRLDPLSVEAVARLEVPVILATGNVHCFTRTTSVLLGISGVSLSENGGVISYGDGQMEVLADISLCEEAYRMLGEVFDLDRMDSRYRITDIVLDRNFDIGRAVSILEQERLAVDLVDSKFAVHIKDRKVDKGTALLKIMDHLRLRPDEIAVVGDSVSDLPMFLVTEFGAAVANASSQLKEAADYVAKEEFGKGAYEIVEYMIEKEMF